MSAKHPSIEITPAEALQRSRTGARLIDIREDGERAAGMARPAQGIAMGRLLADPAAWLTVPDAEVLLICASGRRSQTAAEALAAQGFPAVRSVAGGTQRWQAEGLPMTSTGESAEFLDRYSRHLLLPEVGLHGQQKLRDSRVALVGAGGLGSPAALYLAAAGVGQITLIDDDRVERSNLQRQVLHRDADIGRPKVQSGRATMLALNPDIEVIGVQQRLRADNVDSLLAGHQVIVDGSDNFATRYLVNDACIALRLPLVYGAVQRFEGQVAVFWSSAPGTRGACYRCLFPQPPAPQFAPNCAEAGVLGVLPGLIGMLQATETVKLLLGIGEPLLNRLLRVDALSMQFNRIGLSHDPECGSCGERRSPGEWEGIVACSAPSG
jgi:molybdopterin/thiamine biosynthesis adenylyltransferase/rhodanese-related sulfurtransferase